MISINENNKDECCGCTACMNICPKNAITMKEDFEGFLYPSINEKNCINCNLCDSVCPIRRKKKEERRKKKEERRKKKEERRRY